MSENKIDNMPSNLFIRSGAEITISAAATDEKGKTACRKMNIACYKGGALMLAGMGGTPTILDISGMAVGKKSYPILKDHNPSQVVGHSTKINKEEQSFTMEASISGTGDAAKEVVNNADNGFPWQSSFGVIAQKIIYCEAGDTIKANGLTFSGPCYVIRKSKLQEQSILALGADDETSATMVAGSAADMGTCKIEREIPMPEDKKIEAAPSVVPAPAPVIPEQETEKKIEAYRKEADNAIEALRIEKISNLPGDSEELKKIKATAISEKWTADKAELEVLRASRQRGFPAIQPVTDETITSDVIVASACKTLGASEEYLLKKHGEKVLNAADKNKIRGLRDLVQAAAALDGKILPRFSGEGHDWFRAAFSTISVPYTIGAVANKFLLDGYNFTEQAWRKCAKIGALQNLQTHTRLKIVGDTIMKVLSADGKIVNAEAAEAVYTITGDTYARMFSLSRKDMINDNISALADIPKMIGMGASKAISVKFWTLVLANTGTFFATTATTSGSQKKANQITGSSYVLSFAGLKQAYSVFMGQVQPDGHPLGIMPKVLVVPPALASVAMNLNKSDLLVEAATAGAPQPSGNIWKSMFEPVVSAYLANSSISGYSSTGYYLLADPNELACWEVAFLDGKEVPTLESADVDFDSLGVQYRGYIDFGVGQQDTRAGVFMTGA